MRTGASCVRFRRMRVSQQRSSPRRRAFPRRPAGTGSSGWSIRVYIEGYVAHLSQEKLGFPDTVIIEVTLDRHDEEVLDRFGRMLTEFPEVLEAYLTTGEYDYLMKVAVEGTSGYERFLREKLYRIPGIRQSRSAFALRCLKRIYSVQP